MIAKKACIVGMHNPLSDDPQDAMEPYTRNGSGERLWAMLNDVHPISREDYLEVFETMNVMDQECWSSKYFKSRGTIIRERVGTRPAAVLGIGAWSIVSDDNGPIRKTDWFEKINNWWLFPHPSGLCRVYNDPMMRMRAGLILAQIGGLL